MEEKVVDGDQSGESTPLPRSQSDTSMSAQLPRSESTSSVDTPGASPTGVPPGLSEVTYKRVTLDPPPSPEALEQVSAGQ